MPRTNRFGQPIGDALAGWDPPPFPPGETLEGRRSTLEPPDWERHGQALFEVLSDAPESLWTYMAFGPFATPAELRSVVEWMSRQDDWLPYAILVNGSPLGFASYLRVEPEKGVIELGSIVFSPLLQRTAAATESLYLMMKHAFNLGYRRLEWKCDDLNEISRRAGQRLGFRYEGTFRQATHYRGRNRDTAWFAVIDADWGGLDAAFQKWLAPANFDHEGTQVRKLADLIESCTGRSARPNSQMVDVEH